MLQILHQGYKLYNYQLQGLNAKYFGLVAGSRRGTEEMALRLGSARHLLGPDIWSSRWCAPPPAVFSGEIQASGDLIRMRIDQDLCEIKWVTIPNREFERNYRIE